MSYRLRRGLFALLFMATMVVLMTALVNILKVDGFGIIDFLLVVLFALTIPWGVIGLWNALIGLGILYCYRDPLKIVAPLAREITPHASLKGRTAVVMLACNENPERIFRHLQATEASIETTGHGESFEYFLLSDTQNPELAAEEARRFAQWQAVDARPERLHYRRRPENKDFKTGNLWEFLETWGPQFDYLLVLDADSLMGGELVVRLTHIMEQHPRVGILQTLVVGLPAVSPFTRIFQFGMRHGMRSYTTGSAWWLGPFGPYWGHNALIRIAPFIEHCKLPTLPGKPPMGGQILSHDQVEAILMRRGGYEVWVLPEEDQSYEENPPTLPDFIKRDLRWCNGNMQYLKLFPMLKNITIMDRIQLLLAIMMYTSAPLWFAFLLLGLIKAIIWGVEGAGSYEAVTSFAVMMAITFSPKICGIVDILLRADTRKAYGGPGRIALSTLIETLFSFLIGPIMALSQTIFIAGLTKGRKLRWAAQIRDTHSVTFGEAFRGLWPQTGAGVLALIVLIYALPGALIWALPLILGLSLAVPFACITSYPQLGEELLARRLCLIPEEHTPSELLKRLELPHLDEPLESLEGVTQQEKA